MREPRGSGMTSRTSLPAYEAGLGTGLNPAAAGLRSRGRRTAARKEPGHRFEGLPVKGGLTLERGGNRTRLRQAAPEFWCPMGRHLMGIV